jgi:hypothetical protein
MSMFGAMSAGMGCDYPKEAISKGEPNIGMLPGICYHLFIGKHSNNPEFISWQNDKTLNTLLPYAQNGELKKKIYGALRGRSFKNINHQAVIVREVVSICAFLHGVGEYARLTFKMWSANNPEKM